jgi:hypothetical protein
MDSLLFRKLCLIIVVAFVVGIGASQSAWGGYEEGKNAYLRGDYATALKEFHSAAEQGNELAQFGLGSMYVDEKGVQRDLKIAIKWYRKSAEQGFAIAQNNLGSSFWRGKRCV